MRDYIYNGLTKRGLAPHVAEGIMWNLKDESSFNPSAIGDNGNAYGLAQWNGPRKRAYESFAAQNGAKPDDIDTQLDFLMHELNGPESNAYAKLKEAEDASQAAIAFNTLYERPAKSNMDRRNAAYSKIYNQNNFEPLGHQDNGALAQNNLMGSQEPSDAPSPVSKGWQDSIKEYLNSQTGSEAMLALGQGLLSGNNWSEGLSAGFGNVISMRQQDKERLAQTQRDEQQFQRQLVRDERLADIRSQNDSSYGKPFNITGRDKKTGERKVFAGRKIGDEYYIQNDEGELIPSYTVLNDVRIASRSDDPAVEGGAGGIPNAISVSSDGIPSFEFKRESEGQAYSYALRAIQADRDIEQLSQYVPSEQMTSLETGLRTWASGNANNKITASVINSVLDDAGFSGTLKSAMSQYLQAVLRSDTGAAYTGVEMADYASAFLPSTGDDEETLNYKSKRRKSQIMALVGRTGTAATWLSDVVSGKSQLPYDGINLHGVEKPNPTPKEPSDTSPKSTDIPPKPAGYDDEGLWEYMTPKERKEIIKKFPDTTQGNPTSETNNEGALSLSNMSEETPIPPEWPYSRAAWYGASDAIKRSWGKK